jgi:hypothetical protein
MDGWNQFASFSHAKEHFNFYRIAFGERHQGRECCKEKQFGFDVHMYIIIFTLHEHQFVCVLCDKCVYTYVLGAATNKSSPRFFRYCFCYRRAFGCNNILKGVLAATNTYLYTYVLARAHGNFRQSHRTPPLYRVIFIQLHLNKNGMSAISSLPWRRSISSFCPWESITAMELLECKVKSAAMIM